MVHMPGAMNHRVLAHVIIAPAADQALAALRHPSGRRDDILKRLLFRRPASTRIGK
jgi:cytochrome b561